MTIDGIPETLPPVAETAERSHFVATESPSASMRRRNTALRQELEDEQIDDDPQESHVLDDLL